MSGIWLKFAMYTKRRDHVTENPEGEKDTSDPYVELSWEDCQLITIAC